MSRLKIRGDSRSWTWWRGGMACASAPRAAQTPGSLEGVTWNMAGYAVNQSDDYQVDGEGDVISAYQH
jgi:hypothetical protein